MRIIALIVSGLQIWTSEVKYYGKLISEFTEENEGETLMKLFDVYMDLKKAFDLSKKVFQFSILFQILETFNMSIQFLQFVTEIQKRRNAEVAGPIIFGPFELAGILWISKNVIIIIVFSTSCEKLYISINNINALCCWLLKSTQSTVQAKRFYKNIQRLNRVAFHKMSACHISTVDGHLPQEFFYFVFANLIVLLQFNFL
ncbi:hypothetical protein HF086_002154 [Spodoptera exigua]|uniref:Uncharacterized protein n=1 Tax=Spodoptera exigua TaxID=7107 RepID=A0A922SGR0_SPOEX|nr:hypothetical protein HF086_002154 [Spodoptera exigua]